MNQFDSPQARSDWEVTGEGHMTDKQRRMLNAVCGDLSKQVIWHGTRLSKDSFRHFLSGISMGWLMVPGYNDGEHPVGFVMLGGSSLDMTRSQACDAITMGLSIGDQPEEQGLKCKPVRWCDAVLLGLGLNPRDMAA